MTNSTRFQFFCARRFYAATANVLAACAVLLLFGLSAHAEFVDLYTGTSTYSIPIVTPPGTNGMEPSLSLNYNSDAGSDWLGEGWGITGLGSIDRRGPNHSGAPTYTSSDTFVLQLGGSQKLVYTGQDLAGNPGNYYHSQIENFMRIEFVGASNSWIVTDKSGTKYFFGSSIASQHSNPGNAAQVFSWKLDKVLDTHGVFWTASYSKFAEGDMYPQQMVYSQGPGLACTSAALVSCRVVDFIPDPVIRPDPRISYSTGAKIVFSHRLQRIEVKLGGQLIRKYTLAYAMSTSIARADRSVSQLTRITETGADGTTALPDHIFTYNIDSQGAALTLSQALMTGDPAEGLGGVIQNPPAPRNCTYQIDMNNDRLDDILVGQAGNYYYYPNLGNDSFGARVNIPNPLTAFPTFCSISVVYRKAKKADWGALITDAIVETVTLGTAPMGGPTSTPAMEIITPVHDTTIMDLDGDGLPDIIYSPGIGQWFWWRNLGNNQFANQMPISQAPPTLKLDDKNVRVTDMNGDGLPDIVTIEGLNSCSTNPADGLLYSYGVYAVYYFRNLGSGQFSSSSTWLGSVPNGPWRVYSNNVFLTTCSVIASNNSDNFSLMDINGDGFADVVGAGSTAYYAPNQSGSSLGALVTLAAAGGVQLPYFPQGIAQYRWVDMNGDGLVDYLVGTAGAYSYYPNLGYSGSGNHMLGSVVNLGGSPGVDLKRDAYMEVADMNGDGFPDFLQGNPGDYRDYRLDYSDTHRLLDTTQTPLGGSTAFAYNRLRSGNTINWVSSSVTTNDGLGLTGTTSYSFLNGMFKGWPQNEFRGYGMVYEYKSASAFKLLGFYQDDALKGKLGSVVQGNMCGCPASFDTNWYYGYAVSTSNGVFQVNLINEKANGYLSNGTLATKNTDYGNHDIYGHPRLVTVSGDDIATRVTATDYVYNPTSYVVNRPSHTETRIGSATGTKINETWFDYDGLTNGQAPTKGDLSRETHWLAGGTNPVTQYAYDSFGNRIGLIDAKVNTCAATGYTSKITYDPTYQTFPVSTTNALCQTTTSTYWGVNNSALTAASVMGAYTYPGLLATATDINNVRSDSYYDVFGRSKANVLPPDTVAAPTTVFGYSMTGAAPSTSTVSKRETTGGGALDSITAVDGLGRVVQTKSEAATAGQYVTQDTFYNSRDWVESVNVPYITFSSAFGRSTTQSKTTTLYDDVGRPTKTTNPDGTFRATSYSGWNLPNAEVANTDERGYVTKRTYDTFNRLTKVVEPTGGGTTSYTYDHFSATMSRNYPVIIDAKGATTGNPVSAPTIDTLGRTIESWDPDNGYWAYTFDANGNLLTQTDNKLQKLIYTYDALNRLKTKTYPDGKVVTNYYDDATAGTYRLGRMWKVTDLTGSATSTYDPRGRQARVDKVIGTTTFTTQTSYDSLDRVDTVTYPDGEVVKNTYNSQGLISKVHSNSYNLDYIAAVNYNALGQVTNRTAGNGKVTTFDYYSLNFRLRNISTPGLQNITFANYDAVGNIVDITDGLKAGTQHFGYDNLNRLTSASSGAVPAFNYSYSYDAVGNMLTARGSPPYTYVNYPAHAPISDGFCSYSYDPNGNMSQSLCGTAKRLFTWNYDNKLASVYDTTKTYGTYNYDYAGKRVKKVEGTVTTLSPFPHYRTNNGAVTKYYFANGERIAERTGGTAATNVYYYHSDHLGSSNEVSNSTGAEVKATLFYPYGENRSYIGTKTLAFKYTGQEYDESTGLHNYGARYYNANFMHFISPDSIVPDRSNPQTFNRYAYVRNNPLNRVDPSGMRDIYIGGAGDQCCSHIVQGYQEKLQRGRYETTYFSYSDQAAILAYANSVPLSEPLNIIGHSYGAHTAAQLASQINRPVTALVTIDPVGVGSVAPFTNNVGVMINVELVPSSGDQSDFIAWLGNLLGGATPTSAANVNYALDLNHARFDTAMTTTTTVLGGNSPQIVIDNINDSYPSPPPDVDPDAYGDVCDDC